MGAGQNGGVKLPPGVPGSLVPLITRVFRDVFDYGFVSAMRTTMIMPFVLLLVGSASCLAIRRRKRSAGPDDAAPATAALPVPEERTVA